jgi:O-antigen/teichoic acid export membrane protein
VTPPTSTLFDKPRLSPNRTIAGNGLITLVATGLAMLATYLFQALVARNLNTTAYGELAAVVATLNVVSIPLFGVCMALTRDVAATYGLYGSELLPLIRPYLTRVGGLTLASVVVLLAALPLLTVFFQFASPTPVLFLALLLVLTNAVGVARSALLGLHQFLSVGINQVLEATLRLLAAGVIIWYWPVESAGLAGYAIGLAAALLFVAWPFVSRPRREAPLPPSAVERQGRDTTWSAIALTASFNLLLNSDLVVVKHFLPPDDAGQYAAVSMLGKVLFVITAAFDVVLFPVATSARARGTDHPAHLRQALITVSAIIVPILGVYWLFGGPLLEFIFGPRFVSVAPLLPIQALGIALLGLGSVLARYWIATGQGIPSVGLLAVVGGSWMGFGVFHNSLEQIVAVVLLMGALMVSVTLSPYVGQLLIGKSARGT